MKKTVKAFGVVDYDDNMIAGFVSKYSAYEKKKFFVGRKVVPCTITYIIKVRKK